MWILAALIFSIISFVSSCTYKQDNVFTTPSNETIEAENSPVEEVEENKTEPEPEKESEEATEETIEDTEQSEEADTGKEDVLIMFHNNQGPMCIKQLDWLDSIKENYPDLEIEEHLTTSRKTMNLLRDKMAEYEQSIGVSEEFRYLPISFYKGKAFSGFNEEVKDELIALMSE